MANYGIYCCGGEMIIESIAGPKKLSRDMTH